MMASVQKMLGVRREELLPASLLFLYLFLVIGAYIMGQSVGDALFLSVYPKHLPHAIVATAFVVGMVVSAYIRLSHRLRLQPLIAGSLLFFAGAFALFWWLSKGHARLAYPLIYILVYTVGAMGPTIGWTLANYLLTTREARRVFGFIGAGAILGGTFCGFLTHAATPRYVRPETLLLLVAAFLAACAVLVRLLFRKRLGLPDAPAAHETPKNLGQSLALIFESRYLLLIAALVAIGCASTTIIGYQFKMTARDSFANKEQLAAFFGSFNGYMGLASFVLQLTLTGRLLHSFGIRVTLFVLPVVFLGGSTAVLLAPSLLTACILKGSHNLLRFSLDKSSTELLYLPVAPEVKSQVKSFIDTFIWRVADGLAGLVLLGFATGWRFSVSRISLVNFVFLFTWMAIAAGVRREYLNVLRRAIERRALDPERTAAATLDSTTTEILALALNRGDEEQLLYGLSLFELSREPAWHPHLRHLLGHQSPAVRQRVLRLLTESGDRGILPRVQAMVRDESPEVRTEALHYLVVHTGCDPLSLLSAGADFPDWSLQGSVVAYLSRMGRPENFAAAQLILQSMLQRDDAEAARSRAEAARVLGQIPPPSELHAELTPLLRDPHALVAEQALLSAGRIRGRELLTLVISRLGEPRVAAAARAALALYGDRAIGTLQDHLNDEQVPLPIRKQIPHALARIATPEAAAGLARSLIQSDPGLRYDILKALNKLRRRDPTLLAASPELDNVLQAEIIGYYRSFQILAAFAPYGSTATRPPAAERLLTRALRERMDHEFERIFRLLALSYPLRDIYNAYVGLTSSRRHLRANALEVLEHLLQPELYRRLAYVLDDDIGVAQKLEFARQLCRIPEGSNSQAVRTLIHSGDRWLAACAIYTIGELGLGELREEIRNLEVGNDSLLQETRQRVLSGLGAGVAEGDGMLTILEKVDILQKAPVFLEVPTESLARVAAICVEASYAAGEALYRENEAADRMFVLFEGEVAVTQQRGRALKLGPYNVLGALAMLAGTSQPESVLATQPSRALLIDQQDFYEVMADDFDLTQGLLRMLARKAAGT
jgi:AAA family ATP:ADP antiporter